MDLNEYPPGSTFTGRMGRTVGESAPAWPAPVRAKPGSPNVMYAGRGTPGIGRLFVDGVQVGQADLPVTVPLALGIGSGFAVGRNPGSPTSTRYTSPFAFTGTISKVTVDVSGKADHDEPEAKKAEARVAMARQ